jgi:hypothetical protein
LINGYSHNFRVHRSRGFAIGLEVKALAGYATLYNQIHLGTLNTCKVSVKLDGDNGRPVNENIFYGGRLNATGSSGNNGEASVYILDGGAAGGGNVNNNKFYGCSLESSGFTERFVRCDGGWYNAFYDCRYEGTPVTEYILLSADTNSCLFHYGFNSSFLKDSANVTDSGTDNVLEGFSYHPALPYRVLAVAYLNSIQANITDVTSTKVLLDTSVYDLGGGLDIANNKFTAPITGYYRITAQVGFTSGSVLAGEYRAEIYVNGAMVADYRGPGVVGSTMTAQLTKTILVTKNQDVELYTYVNVGASTVDLHTGANNTFLEVELVKK